MPSADQLKVFSDIASSAFDDLSLSLIEGNIHPINIKTCRDSIDDLAMAADIIEFGTLGDICKTYSDNFFESQEDDNILSPEKSLELAAWSKNLISFIRSPDNVELANKITVGFSEKMRNRLLESLFSDSKNELINNSSNKGTPSHSEDDRKHKINIPLQHTPDDPIQLFINEISEMEEKIDRILCEILLEKDSDLFDNIDRYLKKINMIGDTADLMGIKGISEICTFAERNLLQFDFSNENIKSVGFELFSQIPGKIITLLSNRENTQHIIDLVTHFENEAWPTPNQEEESHSLVTLLSETDTTLFDEAQSEPSKTLATDRDVSISVSSDVHPDLISAFLHDAPNQASDLGSCISLLGKSDDIRVHLESAQRLTHSIKGSANIVELFGIANMAHYLEEILEELHTFQDHLTAPLLSLMEESADCIEMMVDHLLGKENEPSDSKLLLQQLLDHINGISRADKENATTEKQQSPKAEENEFTFATEVETEVETEKAADPIHESYIQVPTKTIESLFEMVEEMTVSLIQTREQVKYILGNAKSQTTQDDKIQEHRFELEKVIDIKALSSSNKRFSHETGGEIQFDSLELDQYSEIHGTVHSFIETVIDSRELNMDMREQLLHLDSLFIKHMRLNKDLQFLTKSTKMIPVKSINSRLQRCVRHAARVTSKQADLTIIDNNLTVDEEVLSELTDPLMHILRNAIAHGIEGKEQRENLGKEEHGNLCVTFSQTGNHIRIDCTDDGQGICEEEVYNSAVQRGLIQRDHQLTQQHCIELLLTSGFSTRESTNQLSGRGVGLDVVNANVKKLGGVIDISSQPDLGTTLSVTVPLSHLSTHAIVISLNYDRYAIPSHSLLQLLPPHSGDVVEFGLQKGYRYNGSVYPLVTIGNLLLGDTNNDNKQHLTIDNLPILLTKVGSTTYALAVDSIQSNQDIIIKPMGSYVNKTHGVNGVAIIADGTLIPVLDIAELISEVKTPTQTNASQNSNNEVDTAPQLTTIMIVDDSLSVRRSLDQLMRDMGYETLLAQDGVQAVELLKQTVPDIVLSDMEMPRMNGLELTSHIKKSEQLRNLPVVMISSRSTQKHRQMAAQSGVNHYLTKPYTESHLLDLVDSLMPTQPAQKQLH